MANDWYMVFAATENEKGEIYWLNRPVGVFSAPTPIDAIKAAAKKHGALTNMFAVPGYPEGIAFMQHDESVSEFGGDTREDRKMLAAIQRQRALLQLGDGGDPMRPQR
jgi:hypothetical protein